MSLLSVSSSYRVLASDSPHNTARTFKYGSYMSYILCYSIIKEPADMSKISQELKALLYLNQRYIRNSYISIKEISDYLEVSERQARRYMEDLNLIPEIDIETKLGRDGGYRLRTPLDKGFAMPENIVLAMSIAMKRNERVEKVLSELPNYVITDVVEGDNKISNEVLDNLEVLISAIQNRKTVTFNYKGYDKLYFVEPYKIIYTNHTYYLKAVHDEELKNFDVFHMSNMQKLGSFKFDKNIEEKCNESFKKYGVRAGKTAVLRVKCKSVEAVLLFDKYYEGKGIKDLNELTYEVVGSDEHELYYPLFRISTKDYGFIDEEFKDKYVKFLENQIRSIKNGI